MACDYDLNSFRVVIHLLLYYTYICIVMHVEVPFLFSSMSAAK